MSKHKIALFVIFLLTACGGSGGSSSGGGGAGSGGGGPPGHGPGDPGTVELSLGTPVIDTAHVADGYVRVRFPDALGDHPLVSVVTTTGVVLGFGDLPDPFDNSYDIATDGVLVFFPVAGSYTATITVADAGDQPQDSSALNIVIPTASQFSISGEVEDGALGSESGVQTDVHLHWNPVSSADRLISTQESSAGTGAFNFNGLVGDVMHFSVSVDGGTH